MQRKQKMVSSSSVHRDTFCEVQLGWACAKSFATVILSARRSYGSCLSHFGWKSSLQLAVLITWNSDQLASVPTAYPPLIGLKWL